MRINWLVRIRNKMFWLALIPAVLMLAQAVLQIVGIDFDYSEISMRLTGAVEALFVVLAILGIVTDPTTEGVGDSVQALQYDEPKRTDDFRYEGTD